MIQGLTDPVPRGNAPLDPFGSDEESGGQIARDFRFIRGSAMLDGDAKLARHQVLLRERPEAFFPAGELPLLVLFVSHRWQSLIEPDPRGTQADSIRTFLRNVGAVAAAASLPPRERIKIVPSLRVHGPFQAANLLGNGLVTQSTRGGLRWQEIGDSVLERIGIWYDFACLPQGTAGFRASKDDVEGQMVGAALRRLHILVSASTVLALRREDDDYAERAWCVAELAIGQ